jgi:TatD DNase family protein
MKIDIHSHYLTAKHDQKQILVIDAQSLADLHKMFLSYGKNFFLSFGIHPWSALNWNLTDISILRNFFLDPRVLMVGEIGLDRVSLVPFSKQLLTFNSQLELAEQVGKPVLLHVVRAMAEILEAKKNYKSVPAWIIHGFRGGKQEAEQYLNKGFYLSFGLRFNKEGLLACPMDRLFMETDDSGVDISLVYKQVIEILQCSAENLEKQVETNFYSIFKI